jgi:hypothetical protein
VTSTSTATATATATATTAGTATGTGTGTGTVPTVYSVTSSHHSHGTDLPSSPERSCWNDVVGQNIGSAVTGFAEGAMGPLVTIGIGITLSPTV